MDKAPVVIQKLDAAVTNAGRLHAKPGPACTPEAVHSLKGDDARAAFIRTSKQVQRLKTQLDQYTDLTADNTAIDHPAAEQLASLSRCLPRNRPAPQSATSPARQRQRRAGRRTDAVDQLDFEFVLFASSVIDYDYIMGLMSRFSQQGAAGSGKQR